MNQFTIEFKTPKELAKKIAEYNELLNPKQEHVESPAGVSIEDIRKEFKEQAKPVVEEIVKEISAKYAHTTAEERTKLTTEEYVTKATEELEQAIAGVEAEKAKEVKPEPVEVVAEETKQDTAEPETPITDFDGNVVEPEELELAEPVEEVQPFDWKEYRAWMSANKEVSLKVKAVFDNHGATSYDSSALTDAIIADLQALRAEVQ